MFAHVPPLVAAAQAARLLNMPPFADYSSAPAFTALGLLAVGVLIKDREDQNVQKPSR